MPINSFLYPGAKFTPAYEVANSLRFNDGSSDNLVRTNASATNNTKYTLSAWVKRSTLGTNQSLLYNWYDGSSHAYIFFATDDKLAIYDQLSGTDNINMKTTAVFRDISAWYHIVVAVDTTESTQADRVKVYINGVEDSIGTRSAQPGSSASLGMKTNSLSNYMAISSFVNNSSTYLDGYICEYVYIDGQALAHTDLGEFDSDSPTIWKPIDVSGLTFGNNGFYLDFEDSSSLGNDAAGSNNFSVNNLTAIDQSTDTCTNNWAVPNILLQGIDITYDESNLQIAIGTTGQYGTQSSIGVNAGRWYMEVKYTATTSAGNDRVMLGIVGNPTKLATYGAGSSPNSGSGFVGSQNDITSYGYYKDGTKYHNENSTSYGDTWTLNDIIGIYLDCEDNKLYFSKNGTVQNSGTGIDITDPASTVSGNYFFAFTDTSSYGGTVQVNFGGATCYSISSSVSDDNGYGNFEYSPNITGDGSAKKFYSLNSKNLAEFG